MGSGCHAPREVAFPAVAGAESLLLVATPRDGPREAWALDWPAASFGQLLPEGELEAFFFTSSLEALLLAPGPVEILEHGGDALPPPVTHLRLVAGAWADEPLAEAPFQLGPLSGDCLARGGCFRDGRCRRDCSCPPITSPEPPVPPAPPVFTPCPAGWSSGTVHTATVCLPQPRVACPCSLGQCTRQLPGDPGCAPLGGGCAGDWPLVAGPALYVAPWGDDRGLGTTADPLATLAAAVARAPASSTIALGRGRFAGSVRVDSDLTIRGVCAGETWVEGGTHGLILGAARHSLRGLTITATAGFGLVQEEGGEARVEGVALLGGPGTSGGLQVRRARVHARELLVEGFFRAVHSVGSTLTLEGAVLTGVQGVLQSEGVARLDALDVEAESPLLLFAGGRLDARRAWLRARGANGADLTGDAVLEDVVIDNDRPGEIHGVLQRAGLSQLRRVQLRGPWWAGYYAAGGEAALEDLVVSGARQRGVLGEGAAVRLTRGLLLDGYGTAVDLASVTRAELTDVLVRGAVDGAAGNALAVGLAVRPANPEAPKVLVPASVQRVVVENAVQRGVYLADVEGLLEDTHVFDGPELAGCFLGLCGAGVDLSSASQITVRRVRVHDRAGTGLEVTDPGTRVVGSDLLLQRTRRRGLSVGEQGTAVLERVRVEGESSTGVGMDGQGLEFERPAELRLFDLLAEGPQDAALRLVAPVVFQVERFDTGRGAGAGLLLFEFPETGRVVDARFVCGTLRGELGVGTGRLQGASEATRWLR